MQLAKYVAQFLADHNIRHAFVVSGGASLRLIHAIANTKGILHVCPQHEQAGAMAADGYSRVTGNLGVAVTTSGPGATNLLTGIACSYYDSVPTLFITGQVSTFRMKKNTGVRQIGFQETDIINMCRPITKYSAIITDPKMIRYKLEKACYLAKSGRPGPVLVDIPDNIQRESIDPNKLKGFTPKLEIKQTTKKIKKQVAVCLKLIQSSKRPIVVLGWGIRLAKAEKEAMELVSKLDFPVALTWGIADIMPADNPLLLGTFGTHGTRHANFAIQNSDLIISIGSRLDTKATGSPPSTFARGAKKIVVDIDPYELSKFKKIGLKIDLLINSDVTNFLSIINKAGKIKKQDISPWLKRVHQWKNKYKTCLPEYYRQKDINPYVFVKTLSKYCPENKYIFIDTGCTVAWMTQAFDFKKNQRLFHDWNNTAMGWALPASIGASLALNGRGVICITGDGSLQMNIQELITIVKYKLPIKIFLINNRGHAMIQQTQDQWLDSKYIASSIRGGLAFPDFTKVAKAYGFKTINVRKNKELDSKIKKVLSTKDPIFCNIEISSKHRVLPQVKFGRPIEDMEPLLRREEFLGEMIVKPLKISKT